MSDGTNVQFNLQRYLEDMRRDQAEAHRELSSKMDSGFKAITERASQIAEDLQEHEQADLTASGVLSTRLSNLEALHNTVRWLGRTAVGALIAGAITLVYKMVVK